MNLPQEKIDSPLFSEMLQCFGDTLYRRDQSQIKMRIVIQKTINRARNYEKKNYVLLYFSKLRRRME